jgi:pyruvate dehydrogenase E2 component (dihydrolipoamide acetyltransferase)
MATEVLMPKMGYDMEEGTLLRWRKSEGDAVARGDILAEIETGKVSIEIEAFDEGVLRAIVVKEGETVPVGAPIAVIGSADEPITLPAAPTAASAPAPQAAPPAAKPSAPAQAIAPAAKPSAPEPAAIPVPADGRTRASPLARRLAAEAGLDLASLGSGSGPGGRIVRDDVLAAASAPAAARPADVLAGRQPLSSVRRTIARRLTHSWQEAPHIFVTLAVEMDAALALREQVNAVADEGRPKVSLNDVVVRAVAAALEEHPLINVSWADGDRIVHPNINIGVAVALADGLMTVTVTDTNHKTLRAIAAEIQDLAGRARVGKLTAAELNAAPTFTISNLGMYGVESFTAILNPPEAAILAVGAAAPEAVVRGGEVVIRSIMRLTLSADHRVIDGATAAEFLRRVGQLLESPAAALA